MTIILGVTQLNSADLLEILQQSDSITCLGSLMSQNWWIRCSLETNSQGVKKLKFNHSSQLKF